VVPEVDQPGHTASWARSPEFEELNACGGAPAANWTQYCYQPPCGQLDPTLNKTYLLVNSVLAEVQSIFPATYVHMGADEFVPSCWKYNTSILTFMEDNNFSGFANLFDYFFKQANQYVGPNRRRIYWNANDLHNLSYIQGGILQYWQGSEESDYASL
jgi:hexosaminidase